MAEYEVGMVRQQGEAAKAASRTLGILNTKIKNDILESMADGLLDRMEEELGAPCTAVATGGLAGVITPYCRRGILHDDSLLLRGLALIWRKNCGNR